MDEVVADLEKLVSDLAALTVQLEAEGKTEAAGVIRVLGSTFTTILNEIRALL